MKIRLLLIILTAFLSSSLYSQTSVVPGDGTLKAAIDAATSGDVLVLQSGGVYTESVDSALTITKEITIKAEDGAAVRPLLKNLSSPTGAITRADMFVVTPDAGLILQGIEVDGLEPDTTVYRSLANVVSFQRGSNYTVKYIKIIDCLMKNVESRIIDGASTDFDTSSGGWEVTLDTLIIDNSLFTNADNVFNFKYILMNYVDAKNSTFWAIRSGRVFRIMSPVDPAVTIDHCTFDNIGTSDRWIDTKNNLSPWMIKNCIFSNPDSQTEIIRIYESVSMIKNCDFWNAGSSYLGLKNGALSENLLEVDPEYSDAANADFTLSATSGVLGQGDDGEALGDLRWVDGAVSVELEDNSIPVEYALYQNYPNPFNPSTIIKFNIPASGYTSLRVFNIIGQEVANLVSGNLNAGSYTVNFNAESLPSGVYVYRLSTNNYTQVQKMVLMK